MAFTGGKLPLVGVAVSTAKTVASGLATSTLTRSISNPTLQTLTTTLAPPLVNVAIDSVLGTEIKRTSGISLTSGTNTLATQLGGAVNSTLKGALNQQIGQALGGIGGSAFSGLATQAAGALVDGLTGAIFGGGSGGGLGGGSTGAGGGVNTFPGAGDEPEAEYGGSVFSLGAGKDVVFSITPVTSGPEATGESSGIPTIGTSMGFSQLAGDAASSVYNLKGNDLLNSAKVFSMNPDTNLSFPTGAGDFLSPKTFKFAGTSNPLKGLTGTAAPALPSPVALIRQSARELSVERFKNSLLSQNTKPADLLGIASAAFDTPLSSSTTIFSGTDFPTSYAGVKAVNLSSFMKENPTLPSAWEPSTFADFSGTFGISPSKKPDGWKFICAPDTIEWNTSAQADRVPIFGTNKPPVVVGTKGMRDLSLSNALVEGFMRSKTVESKIAALENLFQYTQGKGFVNVPVFHVTASNKKYGGSDGGYFVMSQLKVKETMRDQKGDATRAFIDVSFVQVPEYQVGKGRDQSTLTSSAATGALQDANKVSTQADQPKPTSGVNGPTTKTPAANAASGAAATGDRALTLDELKKKGRFNVN